MYEYTFHEIKLGVFTGEPKDEYQDIIMDYARRGWRLASTFHPAGPDGQPFYFVLIFERKLQSEVSQNENISKETIPAQEPMALEKNSLAEISMNDDFNVDVYCPVRPVSAKLMYHETDFNFYCLLSFAKQSSFKLSAIKFDLLFFDAFHEVVGQESLTFSQNVIVDNGNLATHKYPLLIENRRAQWVDVSVSKILFGDGSTWEKGVNGLSPIEISREELIDLRKVAGMDACGYAKSNIDSWQCVCGRGNGNDHPSCQTCGREKEPTIKDFSSRENIVTLIEMQKEREFNSNLDIKEISVRVERLKAQGAISDTDYQAIQEEIRKNTILKNIYGLSDEQGIFQLITKIKQCLII